MGVELGWGLGWSVGVEVGVGVGAANQLPKWQENMTTNILFGQVIWSQQVHCVLLCSVTKGDI